jgi:hypothetical protein
MGLRVVTHHTFEFDGFFVGHRHFSVVMINIKSLLASLLVY